MSAPTPGIIGYFSVLPDPRRKNHNKKLHDLTDIIVIAVLAVVSGADTWDEIAVFGEEKREWLKTFCKLANGIPSHDTFARVFSILDNESFERCFIAWVRALCTVTKGGVIAIDGKSVRRAHGKDMRPLHLVNAFATENGVVLGHRKVDGKSNEITAIPELLEMLSLEGCIVTTDAMGTQCWIAKKIKEYKADYVLAVKGNQGRLHADMQKILSSAGTNIDRAETSERAHGRIEKRECIVTQGLAGIRDADRWDGLQAIACVIDTRIVNGKTSKATRYFISSLAGNAATILGATRAHWGVENNLHWTLDVVFREDMSRIRIGHAQENFALLRKFALNMLKKETSAKGGLKSKRYRAGLSTDYLLKVVTGNG
jgi:predicted transposase YbfD/YdcC